MDKSRNADATPRIEYLALTPEGRERLREIADLPGTALEFRAKILEVLERHKKK